MIAALDRNGLTYRADGSVYFRISGMPRYGALAHLDLEGMKAGATVEADTLTKEDVRDFVLWKGARPGEPAWDLVDPPGRPGWHLECSAMALRLLGEPPIDIHTGGIDLIFPHHENEIAQSEGATGKPFSRFWMHIEHLLVDDQKMSKSLGNTYTISDILERGFRASALRYLLLSSHYRKQLNFTWSGLAEKEESLRRLMDCLARVDRVTAEGSHEPVATFVDDAQRQFSEAMQDDLNTAAALAAMFDLVRAVNSAIDADHFGRGDAATVRSAFDGFDRVLGILTLRREEDEQPPVPVAEIDRRIEERNAARRRRDFSAADRIRDELAVQGIILEDSAAGTRWKRK
jgi:cysteinyl-tRNA synthetase